MCVFVLIVKLTLLVWIVYANVKIAKIMLVHPHAALLSSF